MDVVLNKSLGSIFNLDNLNFDFGTIFPTSDFKDIASEKTLNDPLNYFNSADYKAGIAAHVNKNTFGDTRTWDEIYNTEKQKNIDLGYKTAAQQDAEKAVNIWKPLPNQDDFDKINSYISANARALGYDELADQQDAAKAKKYLVWLGAGIGLVVVTVFGVRQFRKRKENGRSNRNRTSR